jgi:hypothetical protein
MNTINSATLPTKPKHAGGRPKKEIKDILPANWQEVILSLSDQGCSEVEIRAKLCKVKGKFSHNIWYELEKRDEEFQETLKKGEALCRAWWEGQGRVNLKAKNFQTGLWTMNMKNRFGWTDKATVGVGNVDDEAFKRVFFGVASKVTTKDKALAS